MPGIYLLFEFHIRTNEAHKLHAITAVKEHKCLNSIWATTSRLVHKLTSLWIQCLVLV